MCCLREGLRKLGYFTLETLQACASISVSKQCNFPIPCLVNFVNSLVFCYFPKYVGLPVLTKYFVKNCLFVSWRRPQLLLFYPNFGPLLHIKYVKIHKKAFSQSCRYGKHLSFETVFNSITVLWAEQLAFPPTFCLPNFSWRSSKHEQKPKLVFVEAE